MFQNNIKLTIFCTKVPPGVNKKTASLTFGRISFDDLNSIIFARRKKRLNVCCWTVVHPDNFSNID